MGLFCICCPGLNCLDVVNPQAFSGGTTRRLCDRTIKSCGRISHYHLLFIIIFFFNTIVCFLFFSTHQTTNFQVFRFIWRHFKHLKTSLYLYQSRASLAGKDLALQMETRRVVGYNYYQPLFQSLNVVLPTKSHVFSSRQADRPLNGI